MMSAPLLIPPKCLSTFRKTWVGLRGASLVASLPLSPGFPTLGKEDLPRRGQCGSGQSSSHTGIYP